MEILVTLNSTKWNYNTILKMNTNLLEADREKNMKPKNRKTDWCYERW